MLPGGGGGGDDAAAASSSSSLELESESDDEEEEEEEDVAAAAAGAFDFAEACGELCAVFLSTLRAGAGMAECVSVGCGECAGAECAGGGCDRDVSAATAGVAGVDARRMNKLCLRPAVCVWCL
jgi:hypothetical protein